MAAIRVVGIQPPRPRRLRVNPILLTLPARRRLHLSLRDVTRTATSLLPLHFSRRTRLPGNRRWAAGGGPCQTRELYGGTITLFVLPLSWLASEEKAGIIDEGTCSSVTMYVVVDLFSQRPTMDE